jgi:hypothetical protein
MWSVFFIRMIVPYQAIRSNQMAQPECSKCNSGTAAR